MRVAQEAVERVMVVLGVDGWAMGTRGAGCWAEAGPQIHPSALSEELLALVARGRAVPWVATGWDAAVRVVVMREAGARVKAMMAAAVEMVTEAMEMALRKSVATRVAVVMAAASTVAATMVTVTSVAAATQAVGARATETRRVVGTRAMEARAEGGGVVGATAGKVTIHPAHPMAVVAAMVAAAAASMGSTRLRCSCARQRSTHDDSNLRSPTLLCSCSSCAAAEKCRRSSRCLRYKG